MHLRSAVVGDEEILFEIRCSVRENFQSRAELDALGINPGSVREMLASNDHFGFIAESDGRPTGFALAQYSAGYVFACFVRPEFEGLGVGRRVLQAVEEKLKSAGIGQVWLSTEANAENRAIGFYRHLGWVEDGCLDNGEVKLVKRL